MIITEIGSAMEENTPLKEEIVTDPSSPPIEDIITEDGILCSILSNLRLREAVATSLLSPRWRHIWTHLPKLIFGPSNLFDSHTIRLLDPARSPLTDDEQLQLLKEKTDQFVLSVNSVMHQYQGCDGADQFVVRYFLRETHFHHLDAWIRVALSSKTKLLGLHLNKPYQTEFQGEKYKFRFPPLGSSSSLEELVLICCSLELPVKFNGLSHLKILELYSIDVTEEDVNRLLSNCHTLEYMRLQGAPRIVTLNIPHPQTQLRHLLVKHCYQCREIKLNAVNLNKFNYNGYPADFIFKQSSQLTHACILFRILNETREHSLDYYLNKVSSNLPNLQDLAFIIDDGHKVPDLPKGPSSRFIHLKRLDWWWNAGTEMNFLHLATFMDAFPFLEDLNLRLCTKCTVEPPKRLRELKNMLPKHPHDCLKTIQFGDFYCCKWHIELALYFLKNAIELESMTISKGDMELNERHMKNLRQEVPTKTKFVIL